MDNLNSIKKTGEIIKESKICIIIPTYNNAKTLKRVIDGVLEYTSHIIIINDGSTDETSSILNGYQNIIPQIIHLKTNQGKGNALSLGFEKARDLGYLTAISIDSDGQHYPSDIENFINENQKNKNQFILIGSRNMKDKSVPKKSSFGNQFSNFWFWFQTGIQLSDTQSGFRLYPLNKIPKKFYTKKFEFEIEILVRSAWAGTLITNIPIKVLYDANERVSHFRPFKDFFRISILNTILVFICLIYIFPRNLLRKFKKKSLKNFIKEDILELNLPAHTKALSIGLGLFVGLSPLWGFHTFIVISLAVLFKLNKGLSILFSNISIPPFIPLIIYSSLYLGSFFIENAIEISILAKNFNLENIKNHLFQYLIGSFLLAFIVSTSIGGISYLILKIFEKK